MKILHILASNTYNGAENVVCQIIDMFRDEPGFEMVYCSPDGAIRNVLEHRNIRFVPIRTLTPVEIKKVINKEKPDIVHAHDRKAGVVCALAKGKTRMISQMHNNPDGAKKLSLESLGYLPAAEAADHIIWVSQDTSDDYYFIDRYRDKSTVLQNTVSADRVQKLAEEDHNEYDYDVIFVGRMVYQKNPERFVNIVKDLSYDFHGIKAAMAGTGELEEDIRKLIDDSDMSDKIDFLGYMDNPYKLIQCSKVLLLPSRWEGLPMVQLEAEALGTSVVRTPGTDEELKERVRSILQSGVRHTVSVNDISGYKSKLKSIYETT